MGVRARSRRRRGGRTGHADGEDRNSQPLSGGPSAGASIVHLGDRFAVLDKPAGLSLRTPRSAPGAAAERLRASLGAEDRDAIGGRELLLVHRLDEPTSGLLLVAFDADEHRRLVGELSARRITKVYLAIVWGAPRPGTGSYQSALGPDRDDRRRMKADPAGRRARTDYLVLARAPHLSLVALWPATGRTHQLRVHLAAAGHPILGDDLYGGPRERGVRDRSFRAAIEGARTMLHAYRLEVAALEPSRFEARLPGDFERVARATGLGLAGVSELWHPPRPSHPFDPSSA